MEHEGTLLLDIGGGNANLACLAVLVFKGMRAVVVRHVTHLLCMPLPIVPFSGIQRVMEPCICLYRIVKEIFYCPVANFVWIRIRVKVRVNRSARFCVKMT